MDQKQEEKKPQDKKSIDSILENQELNETILNIGRELTKNGVGPVGHAQIYDEDE